MKTGTLSLIIILGIIVVLGGCGAIQYNGIVTKDENVKSAWGKVQAQYARRSDLIPSLVATVKGAANFEKSTLTEVTEARSKAIQIRVDSSFSPENIKAFEQSQQQLRSSLDRLMVVAEKYPELTATKNFSELQVELSGTNNRITRARNDFNEAVQDYNSAIRTFPGNIFAGMSGFRTKGYFESQEGDSKAPPIDL